MEDSRVSQKEDAQDNSDFDWVVRGVSRDPEKARFILLSRGGGGISVKAVMKKISMTRSH